MTVVVGRVAVIVKQIPKFEQMTLGPDGRLVRDGIPLDLNAYCRRAVNQACLIAAPVGAAVTVITLGPPSAEDSVREAVAWCLDRDVDATGVVISDPAFAGSDTLATAKALHVALSLLGPFDLVLAGRNSVDADTGQVPPQLAEMLGWPLLGGVKRLDLDGRRIEAGLETDDGWLEVAADLPAVVSCAERLCEPAKVPPEGRAAVPADRIRTMTAADLGAGPWGAALSPTKVGDVRTLVDDRARRIGSGSVTDQVAAAVDALVERGALQPRRRPDPEPVPEPGDGPDEVWVVVEPDRPAMTSELLGGAAVLANRIGGSVTAVVVAGQAPAADEQSTWGADRVIELTGLGSPWDAAGVAAAVADAASESTRPSPPWGLIAPSTLWGREVAARVSARLDAGLTGDAVELGVAGEDRLVAWKPAFGGAVVAAIWCKSATQAVTVRAGVLSPYAPRPSRPIEVRTVSSVPSRLEIVSVSRDDDVDVLAHAEVVIGVGQGIDPADLDQLDPLAGALGAVLGATRKATDQGWMPRARQIGITGRTIRPRLFVSIGSSGKFNHMVGVRGADTVLTINPDPEAPVWDFTDVGIVAPWQEAVPALVRALATR